MRDWWLAAVNPRYVQGTIYWVEYIALHLSSAGAPSVCNVLTGIMVLKSKEYTHLSNLIHNKATNL